MRRESRVSHDLRDSRRPRLALLWHARPQKRHPKNRPDCIQVRSQLGMEMSLLGSQTGRKTGKMIQACLAKSGQMRISGIGGCSHSGTKVRDPGRSTNIQIYVGGFNGERALLTCWQGFDMVAIKF